MPEQIHEQGGVVGISVDVLVDGRVVAVGRDGQQRPCRDQRVRSPVVHVIVVCKQGAPVRGEEHREKLPGAAGDAGAGLGGRSERPDRRIQAGKVNLKVRDGHERLVNRVCENEYLEPAGVRIPRARRRSRASSLLRVGARCHGDKTRLLCTGHPRPGRGRVKGKP